MNNQNTPQSNTNTQTQTSNQETAQSGFNSEIEVGPALSQVNSQQPGTQSSTNTQTQTSTKTTSSCGDGQLDSNEECDGNIFLNDQKSCTYYISPNKATETIVGNVLCNSECKIDTSNCKIMDSCLGENQLTSSKDSCCSSQTTTKCTFLFFGCKQYCTKPLPFCGNNYLNSGEECDGTNLNGKTCADLGYNSGKLGCTNCKFTGCYNVRINHGKTENAEGSSTANSETPYYDNYQKEAEQQSDQIAHDSQGWGSCPDCY